MRHRITDLAFVFAAMIMLNSCTKAGSQATLLPATDTAFFKLAHLDYLYTPVTMPDGTNAAGIYIYADAPDYHLVSDSDEGFTCVDDVSRAVLVYIRNQKYFTDTAIQTKVNNLTGFLIKMQSDNGYFYNFMFPNGEINKTGSTSINNANWWSWRALLALTEATPLLQQTNPALYTAAVNAINKLIAKIKSDLIPMPQSTRIVNGITIPTWLPAGSGTDQAAAFQHSGIRSLEFT